MACRALGVSWHCSAVVSCSGLHQRINHAQITMTDRNAAIVAIKAGLAERFELVHDGIEGHRVAVVFRREPGGKRVVYKTGNFLRQRPKDIQAEAEKKLKRMGASAEQIAQLITV